MSFSDCYCGLLFCNSWALRLFFWSFFHTLNIYSPPYCFPVLPPVSLSICFSLRFSLELSRATTLQVLPAIFFKASSLCIFPIPPLCVPCGTPCRAVACLPSPQARRHWSDSPAELAVLLGQGAEAQDSFAGGCCFTQCLGQHDLKLPAQLLSSKETSQLSLKHFKAKRWRVDSMFPCSVCVCVFSFPIVWKAIAKQTMLIIYYVCYLPVPRTARYSAQAVWGWMVSGLGLLTRDSGLQKWLMFTQLSLYYRVCFCYISNGWL